MIGLVSIGMTFVILTGGIDLSVGSIAAVAAVVAAGLSNQFVLIPVAIPIIVGAVIGCVNGLIITKLRIQPFIATLSMMLGVRGIAFIISKGEPVRSPHLSEAFTQIARGDIFGIPNFGVFFIVSTIIGAIVLKYTSFGRRLYAIGGTLLTGGVGNVINTICAVFILGIISNAMNLIGTLPYWYANLATGIILLVVILMQSRFSAMEEL